MEDLSNIGYIKIETDKCCKALENVQHLFNYNIIDSIDYAKICVDIKLRLDQVWDGYIEKVARVCDEEYQSELAKKKKTKESEKS